KSSGGLFVIDAPNQINVDGPAPYDTTYQDITVRSLNSNGTPEWNKTITLKYLVPFEFSPLNMLSARTTASDGLLLVVRGTSAEVLGGMLTVLSFDASGNLVWCKRGVGDAVPDAPEVAMLPNEYASNAIDISMTDDDHTLFAFQSNSLPGTRLALLDANGNLAWARHIQYTAAPYEPFLATGTRLSSGEQLVIFKNNYPPNNPTLIALKLNSAGVLLDKDIYSGFGDLSGFNHVTSSAQGGWAVANYGIYAPYSVLRTLEVGADDSVLRASMAGQSTIGDYHYRSIAKDLHPASNGFTLVQGLNKVHSVLSTYQYFIASSALNSSDPTCLFEPEYIQHHVIPDSLITQGSLPAFSMTDVAADVRSESPLTDAAPIQTSGLCDEFTGVTALEAPPAFSLISSVIRIGSPVRLNAASAGMRFMIYTSSGTLVTSATSTRLGVLEIQMPTANAGAYYMRAIQQSGASAGAAKFVIE
ncbi:MAG TPA: hypothetical protein PK760_06895, partial [Flavobacteriales bacterium]|nr:hypothetical protein [Flavobacteriales bacterium]